MAINEIKNIVEANNIDCGYSTQDSYVYTQEDDFVAQIKMKPRLHRPLVLKPAL